MKPVSSPNTLFTTLEKRSILGLSGILFFRMYGLFLVLPVFSVMALELEEATPVLVGIALGVYGVTQGLLQVPFGMLSDRIGRKPVIMGGLLIFMFGTMMAALTETVYWMIFARFLQGAGAVSSAIFAFIADRTRPEVRTRANAFLGGSVGLSFGLAVLSAPFMAQWFGLEGIFWLITGMTMVSMVFLLWGIPENTEKKTAIKLQTVQGMLAEVWRQQPLRVINLGGFICGTGLSLFFFLVPLIMREHGYERSELWMVYLPMLILGGLSMVPAAIIAESRNRYREVMLAGILLFIGSLLMLGINEQIHELHWFLPAFFLFFMGFNVFEPLFPSLVSRLTTEQTKGTATGVYNFFQFMGHFFGAVLAGICYQKHFEWILAILCVLEMLFFYVTLNFQNPGKTESDMHSETARAVSS